MEIIKTVVDNMAPVFNGIRKQLTGINEGLVKLRSDIHELAKKKEVMDGVESMIPIATLGNFKTVEHLVRTQPKVRCRYFVILRRPRMVQFCNFTKPLVH